MAETESQPPNTTTTTTTPLSPEAPIALAPGYRATNFIALYNHALDKTLHSMSYENFAACFPTIAEKAGDTLRGAHRSVVETLGRSARAEFEKILEDRQVITNLNALEDLISSARTRQSQSTSSNRPEPPHNLAPATLLSSQLTPLLISQNSQLNARLQTVQSQNAGLLDVIRQQREEIENLLAGIEGTVGDLEGAGVVLVNQEGESKSVRARAAEEILVGVK